MLPAVSDSPRRVPAGPPQGVTCPLPAGALTGPPCWLPPPRVPPPPPCPRYPLTPPPPWVPPPPPPLAPPPPWVLPPTPTVPPPPPHGAGPPQGLLAGCSHHLNVTSSRTWSLATRSGSPRSPRSLRGRPPRTELERHVGPWSVSPAATRQRAGPSPCEQRPRPVSRPRAGGRRRSSALPNAWGPAGPLRRRGRPQPAPALRVPHVWAPALCPAPLGAGSCGRGDIQKRKPKPLPSSSPSSPRGPRPDELPRG